MDKTLIVDISHHQLNSKINWAQAAKEVALFIIRTQYGTTTIDKEYKKHVSSCKQHNIPFGHYIYSLFKDRDDAVREAKDFLSRCDKEAKFLVVDVEEQTTKTKAEMAPATQAFIDYLKANDSRPIGLYTGHHFYKPYGMDKVKADFLWIPRYGSNSGQPEVKPDYPCDLWQYTEKGCVSWYSGPLDLNKLNGSKTLDWFIGKEKTKVSEQKLTDAQEAVRQEAMRLGITDGKNPLREVNQYYVWNAMIPLAKKIEELEQKLK